MGKHLVYTTSSFAEMNRTHDSSVLEICLIPNQSHVLIFPGCSDHTISAIDKYGTIKGLMMGIKGLSGVNLQTVVWIIREGMIALKNFSTIIMTNTDSWFCRIYGYRQRLTSPLICSA